MQARSSGGQNNKGGMLTKGKKGLEFESLRQFISDEYFGYELMV